MPQTLACILTLCSSSLIRFLFKKMHVQYHCFGNIKRLGFFCLLDGEFFEEFVLGFVVLLVWDFF